MIKDKILAYANHMDSSGPPDTSQILHVQNKTRRRMIFGAFLKNTYHLKSSTMPKKKSEILNDSFHLVVPNLKQKPSPTLFNSKYFATYTYQNETYHLFFFSISSTAYFFIYLFYSFSFQHFLHILYLQVSP